MMRSKLTNDIFQDELLHLYKQKDLSYQEVRDTAQEAMRDLVREMKSGICDCPVIEDKLFTLVEMLQDVKGKKMYGYLKKSAKTQVDAIVDELAKLPAVAECYEVWNTLRDELENYYKDKPRERLPLSQPLVSFLLVILISLACALLLWSSRAMSEILEPYLVVLNSLPKSALAPLFLVWMGNNTKTIIVAAVSVALFGSILTLHTGFSQTDPEKIKLIYSLGGTKKDVLAKVLLPSSIPLIISSMKVNIGLCLVGVIIGEFLSSRAGLGYLITYGSQTFS